MSKGSTRRPSQVSEEQLQENWDRVFSIPKEEKSEKITVTFKEGSYRPPRIVDEPRD